MEDLDTRQQRLRPRQSPCNWGKSTQTFVSIAIRPVFLPKRSSSNSTNNEPKAMVRSSVKISLDQYRKLHLLRKERKEPLSKLIREALCHFTRRKEHFISTLPSFLSRCTSEQYRTVTAYFPQQKWKLLDTVSNNTGRCKTELVREAVEEYLRKSL